MKRVLRSAWMVALAAALAACGSDETPVASETVVQGPLTISVRGEGELRSAKPTPLNVPGKNWAQRQVEWMLPEGSLVKKGDVLARFVSPEGEQQLAQAMIDLQRNALARAAKESGLDSAQGRVEVDLSRVAVQLGIAQRYADADLSTVARNQVLDAIEDKEYLQVRQGVLQWQRDQSGVRGGAELAVLDAQRATFDMNAKTRKDDLEALELRAPNDGVLLLAANWSGDKPTVGANLRAGFEFGSLPDTSAMEVEIDLPQIEAQGVQAGDAASARPPGPAHRQHALVGGQRRQGAQPREPGEVPVDARADPGRRDRALPADPRPALRRLGGAARRQGCDGGAERGHRAARRPPLGAGEAGQRLRGARSETRRARHRAFAGAVGPDARRAGAAVAGRGARAG
ncbi:hypothetical protein [Pseudoxanthomonas sp.]|jgi:hypothetical protein|uniref:hypothetical protein n=1 Tax=Pseudoxanthomonas sp. TaxID=1871049 RepID=UPI002E13BD94|nr:hypothetical protein [Pseudoxanthomonas sp.]